MAYVTKNWLRHMMQWRSAFIVASTIVLVLSLAAVFSVAPVAASPGEDEQSTYDFPSEGEDSDHFYDATIANGPGPIARDIDDYFWAYVDIGGTDEIVKSLDTEGAPDGGFIGESVEQRTVL